MQKHLQYIFIFVSLVLVACGGGGGGTAGSGGSETYLAVTGVKNVTGKPVVTVCLNNVANVSANDAAGQRVAEDLARFYFIEGNYKITSSSSQGCNSLPGAVVVTVDYYNNTIFPWIKANPVSSGGAGTGNSGGSNPSSGGTVTTNLYRDANEAIFSVSSETGNQVYSYRSGPVALLNGLTISGTDVLRNGALIGYISATYLYCSNKTKMTITITPNGWSESCTKSSGSVSAGSGNSNSGSGQTPSAGVTYITWTNSVNGTIVKDASDDSFAFNASTRCLYSVNTGKEFNNACLSSSGYGYMGTFDGTRVYVVAAKNKVGAGCVAVFADEKYNAVDLFTSNGQEYFMSTDVQWVSCN